MNGGRGKIDFYYSHRQSQGVAGSTARRRYCCWCHCVHGLFHGTHTHTRTLASEEKAIISVFLPPHASFAFASASLLPCPRPFALSQAGAAGGGRAAAAAGDGHSRSSCRAARCRRHWDELRFAIRRVPGLTSLSDMRFCFLFLSFLRACPGSGSQPRRLPVRISRLFPFSFLLCHKLHPRLRQTRAHDATCFPPPATRRAAR